METVAQLIASRKTELESGLVLWAEVERGVSDVTAWMKDVERRLELDSDAKSDLSEKKLRQHRVKV